MQEGCRGDVTIRIWSIAGVLRRSEEEEEVNCVRGRESGGWRSRKEEGLRKANQKYSSSPLVVEGKEVDLVTTDSRGGS